MSIRLIINTWLSLLYLHKLEILFGPVVKVYPSVLPAFSTLLTLRLESHRLPSLSNPQFDLLVPVVIPLIAGPVVTNRSNLPQVPPQALPSNLIVCPTMVIPHPLPIVPPLAIRKTTPFRFNVMPESLPIFRPPTASTNPKPLLLIRVPLQPVDET